VRTERQGIAPLTENTSVSSRNESVRITGTIKALCLSNQISIQFSTTQLNYCTFWQDDSLYAQIVKKKGKKERSKKRRTRPGPSHTGVTLPTPPAIKLFYALCPIPAPQYEEG